MSKKANRIYLILILVLGFFVFNLVFPQYLNQGIDSIKPFLSKVPLLRALPRFPERPFRLGLDLQGGSRLVYQADLSTIGQEERAQSMQGLRDVIERRVNLFGVTEPNVAVEQAADDYRLVVELPGVHDIEKAIEMIGQTPYLDFRSEIDPAEKEEILAKRQELEGLTWEEIQQIDNWQLGVKEIFEPTELNGQYLAGASLSFNQTTFEPEVILEFNEEGARLFKEITSLNIGKQLAIYIDDVLISAPKVNEEISQGAARITGSFTVEEAKELVRNLNAGALPVPIELISQNTIGPTLGEISLQKSLLAAAFGFICIVLFMVVFYRLSGLLASCSLVFYVLMLLTLFKFIPITLTLAGIGGAVLSIGMAVDANVLIFERYREEKEKEENFAKAVETAFSRAWPSIRDGNFTTILVGLIMFSFGTSFVKGFALTLSLGILVSMFSALFITRIFLRSFIGSRLEKVKWLWQ